MPDRDIQGSRAELEKELRELAEGWSHLGNSRRRKEVVEALETLRAGADEVRAGHTCYRVAPEVSGGLR